MKKYELTDETKKINGKTLYRIKALKNLEYDNIKAGDLGGFVEKEKNLSHYGNCWIYHNSCVYDKARVSGNAKIIGECNIYDRAKISDNAWVENSEIFNDAYIFDNGRVYNCIVKDNSNIFGDAHIYRNCTISGKSRIYGEVQVKDDSTLQNVFIYGNGSITTSELYGSFISDKVNIINGYIKGEEYIYISNLNGFNGGLITNVTAYKTKDDDIYINMCYDGFKGTLNEYKIFIKAKEEDGEDVEMYRAIYNLIKARFN